jgi:hypothetical protein
MHSPERHFICDRQAARLQQNAEEVGIDWLRVSAAMADVLAQAICSDANSVKEARV